MDTTTTTKRTLKARHRSEPVPDLVTILDSMLARFRATLIDEEAAA